jgi:hypothetical protein
LLGGRGPFVFGPGQSPDVAEPTHVEVRVVAVVLEMAEFPVLEGGEDQYPEEIAEERVQALASEQRAVHAIME